MQIIRSKVFDCGILYLPGNRTEPGTLTPARYNTELPFAIQRAYYLYDIPGGASRGGHAHKQLEQVIVAVSGSFDITLDDGGNKRTVQLNRSHYGLHLRPGIWREINNFSSGAICLALASRRYEEGDYVRDYTEFCEIYGAD